MKKLFFLLFLFFLFAADQAHAYGNLCCTYYKGGGPANTCNALNVDNPNDEAIASNFSCSAYQNGSITINGETTSILSAQGDVVYSTNLSGGYNGKIQFALYDDVTAENSCFLVPGYTTVLLKDKVDTKNSVNNNVCRSAEIIATVDPFFKFDFATAVDAEKAETQKKYAAIQDLAKKLCCYQKGGYKAGESPDLECKSPTIKKQITEEYEKSMNAAVMPVGISSFVDISPDTYDPNDGALTKYFSCGDLPAGGTEYLLILKATKMYCPCTIDRSDCGSTTYLNLKTDNLYTGCQDDMEKKNAAITETMKKWDCVPVNIPKNFSKTTDYCAFLKNKPSDYKAVKFAVPEVGDLNRIGTTDATILIARFIKALLGILGSISLAMFVYSGILYMTDMGNSERAAKAKQILVWNSMGLAVIFASYAIVQMIFDAFK